MSEVYREDQPLNHPVLRVLLTIPDFFKYLGHLIIGRSNYTLQFWTKIPFKTPNPNSDLPVEGVWISPAAGTKKDFAWGRETLTIYIDGRAFMSTYRPNAWGSFKDSLKLAWLTNKYATVENPIPQNFRDEDEDADLVTDPAVENATVHNV